MAKKSMSNWFPSKKIITGLISGIILLTVGGIGGYLSLGALKGYEVSSVRADVKEVKTVQNELKKEVEKDRIEVKERLARIEAGIEAIKELMGASKKSK